MGGLAGIIGSAMGGAVGVLAPVVQTQAIDELRAKIQAKRDAALFGHDRAMQGSAQAHASQEAALGREHETGIVNRQMGQADQHFKAELGQRGSQFDREFGQRDAHHQDDVRLAERELDLIGAGGARGRPTDLQFMMNFLQTPKEQGGLGLGPEQALERYEQMKRDPNEFIQTYVLAKLKMDDPLSQAMGTSSDPETLVEEARGVYERIRGGGRSARDEQPASDESDPLGIRGFLNQR